VGAPIVETPAPAAISVAGQVPVEQTLIAQPVGTLSVTGQIPIVAQNIGVIVGSGTLSVDGQTPLRIIIGPQAATPDFIVRVAASDIVVLVPSDSELLA
jgi:hypothetical protein